MTIAMIRVSFNVIFIPIFIREFLNSVFMFGVPFLDGKYIQGDVRFSDEELELSKRMMNHWANFARDADPGWEEYS